MRTIYFALFMVFSLMLSAQESLDFNTPNENEISGFKLYPNPAFGDVVNVITQDNGIKQITVYDVFGELVLKDQISRNQLSVSRLVPGVYVLQVSENNKTITRKLVIK
ncbi:MAG: T9SS type A sorting domain-containing protein [Flavobacteriaceae bacterium]|nr:T9SS type A sorting domain-containing protein [Flavobacteriaceae bacterium]NNE75531.1 T9SS type A sorting domain-containing protein [Pricia sp.]